MVDYITIEDRSLLHNTTKRMLEILIERVNNDDDINLNMMLLKRVWRAALTCQGFTPSMKDDIVFIAGLDDRTAIEFGLAPHASFWNKLWTIGPKREAPVDLLLVSTFMKLYLERTYLKCEADSPSGTLPRSARHAPIPSNCHLPNRPKRALKLRRRSSSVTWTRTSFTAQV
jgi:hypothetical protein